MIKKVIIITRGFQEILNVSGRKTSKIWVDKGSKFYGRSMNNDIEMYSIHNEKKSVVADRFIRTLKNKI